MDMVEQLWSHADRRARNDQGRGICHLLASRGGSEGLLQSCIDDPPCAPLDARDAFGDTALDVCIVRNHVEAAKVILSAPEDPAGYPLHLACDVGEHNMIRMLVEKHPEWVRVQDGLGRTPLHRLLSAQKFVRQPGQQRLELVRLLLESAAPIHVVDLMGRTPWHLAVGNGDNADPELLALLDPGV